MKKRVLLLLFTFMLIGYVDAAVISGGIYEDYYGNGVLSNKTMNSTINLFNVDTFENIIFNAGQGSYEFNVDKGSYMVFLNLNNNEIITYPGFGFHHVIIEDNSQIINNKDFGEFTLGKISGYVYDKNDNILSNVKVSLSNNFTYLTNEQGYYEFSNLDPGTYTINIEDNSINDILITSGMISANNSFNIDVVENKDNSKDDSWLDKVYRELFL